VRRRRAEAAWFEGELIAAVAEQGPTGEPAAPPAAARKVRVAAKVEADKDDRPHQVVKKKQVKVASRNDDDNDDRLRRRRRRHRDDANNEDD
jgi:hypothetical protein